MRKMTLSAKELTRLVSKYCKYDSSAGEFLLPVVNAKRTPLYSLKKLFDGRNFSLKAIDLEKVESVGYILVIKGKKQKL
jgi:hypothetical protein